MGHVRVGTCSWTEKTMVGLWYPRGVSSAEARLRFYASRFDTVEVDSTFYALPEYERCRLWAERTPDWFVFHVKAFGLMTRHSVDPRALEPPLDTMEHALTSYGRVTDPSTELLDAVFERFCEGIESLLEAGKLGGILIQLPPWVTARDERHRRENLDYLEYVRDRLDGYRLFVEFRDASWVADSVRRETMSFLVDRGMSFVSVDSPQFEDGRTMPPIAEATSDWACVRLHGRNRETWSAPTKSAADRFDYLYSRQELSEWEGPVRSLAAETNTTWVLFNNNKYDYAQRNAADMNEILEDLLLPVPHESGPERCEQGELF